MNKQNRIRSIISDCVRKLINITEDYIACIIGVFALFGIGCALSMNVPYNYFPYDMNGIFDTCLYSGEIYIGSSIMRCVLRLLESYYTKITSTILWRLLCFIIKISKLIFTLTFSIFVFIGFQFVNMGLDKNFSFAYVLQLAIIILIFVEMIKLFYYMLREKQCVYSNKSIAYSNKEISSINKSMKLKQNKESTIKNDEKIIERER